jgi:hypothetical protein
LTNVNPILLGNKKYSKMKRELVIKNYN